MRDNDKWWKVNPVSFASSRLNEIIEGLVFNCPSSFSSNSKNNIKTNYSPVSARNCSFRERRINGSCLTTLLADVKNEIKNRGLFEVIEAKDSVVDSIRRIMESSSFDDPYFEIVVYKKHSQMSLVESIYYYVRNAFAHGSFEILQTKNGITYYLESGKKGEIKARMRLRERTLLRLIELSHQSEKEIRGHQKRRKK